MAQRKIILSGIKELSKEVELILAQQFILEYRDLTTNSKLVSALNECDIFWFRLNHKLTKKVLSRVKCKVIVCAVTGLDHIDVEYCNSNNIKIISLKGEYDFLKHIRATAEHTIGLTISLLRNYKLAFTDVDKGKWNREPFLGSEIYEKKVGILGLGRLGKITADIFKAFGASVKYFDIEDKNSTFEKFNSIEDLFQNSQIISIHLPLDNSTTNLLNENIFKLAIEQPFLINTSRGAIVNEFDLIKALEDGNIKGYASDVITKEPDIQTSTIYSYSKSNSNVLLSPHIGGLTSESVRRTELFVAKKIISEC